MKLNICKSNLFLSDTFFEMVRWKKALMPNKKTDELRQATISAIDVW